MGYCINYHRHNVPTDATDFALKNRFCKFSSGTKCPWPVTRIHVTRERHIEVICTLDVTAIVAEMELHSKVARLCLQTAKRPGVGVRGSGRDETGRKSPPGLWPTYSRLLSLPLVETLQWCKRGLFLSTTFRHGRYSKPFPIFFRRIRPNNKANEGLPTAPLQGSGYVSVFLKKIYATKFWYDRVLLEILQVIL